MSAPEACATCRHWTPPPAGCVLGDCSVLRAGRLLSGTLPQHSCASHRPQTDPERCPTCGAGVTVVSSGGGSTHGFQPTADAEVARLREGIRRFRVSQGHHLAQDWADHFDELVPPDSIWLARDKAIRAARGG